MVRFRTTAENSPNRLDRLLGFWVDSVGRLALLVVLAACGLTWALFYFAVSNLGINVDTGEMLSEDLEFRRAYLDYKKAFPQYDDTLLLVLDGDTPDLVQDASTALADRLELETDLIETVYQPGGGEFFKENALLYRSPAELEDLADNLAKVQPFLAKLTRDRSLRGLFSMLTSAVDAVLDGNDMDLTAIFEPVTEAVESVLDGGNYTLSWQELMLGGESTSDQLRQFIVVKPRLDYGKLLPAEAAIHTIRRLAQELNLDENNGVRMRITGDVALKYEEMQSVSRGAEIAGLAALLLAGAVLFAGLRSPRLVVSTLLTLVMGLIWTAGFAAFAVGHLNLMSVTFAVLYIGLSVDYAIHFCLRYRELMEQGQAHASALRCTAQDIGGSLVLCTLTTALAFYAFIPTAFTGVAELGLISGTGMFISLVANLTVLPALLSLAPLSGRSMVPKPASGRLGLLLSLPTRRAVGIRRAALILGLGGALLLSQVSFDSNPMNLRDPRSESVATFTELLARDKNSPWTLNFLTANAQRAGHYADRLAELDLVQKTLTLNDFVPPHQDEKLDIIEQINLLVGPELVGTNLQPSPTVQEQMGASHELLAALDRYLQGNSDGALTQAVQCLRDGLARFCAVLTSQEPSCLHEMLTRLENSLLGSLPPRLDGLAASLRTDRFTVEDLPRNLVERWVAADGRHRVEIFPREDLNDPVALQQFVAAVHTVAPNATGFPVVTLEAGNAVVKALRQALFLSLAAIAALLLILMRKKLDTLLVLLPLLLAGTLTGAASVLLDIPFNFANVIALPLILGIGVDNGIHMVHRVRTAPPPNGQMLHTSTARAVLYSALTTVSSFGILALSAHRGMAGMGKLLTIGVGITLICTLIVVPALLTLDQQRQCAT
ncbi:MAG: MMPL family transporter [Syntrophobacteria bacterium]